MACPPTLLIGIDEAGRGPLAGPVVAAAVVLGPDAPAGLDDSKRLTARRRAALDPAIRATCRWGLGVVDAAEIDRTNILLATMEAMTRAVEALLGDDEPADVLALIDGNLTPHGRAARWRWPARAIIGGDASEPAISAASILAKQHRDALMLAAHAEFPHYGWDRNAGYGTREHLAALAQYGACPLHRRSFAPVARVVAGGHVLSAFTSSSRVKPATMMNDRQEQTPSRRETPTIPVPGTTPIGRTGPDSHGIQGPSPWPPEA